MTRPRPLALLLGLASLGLLFAALALSHGARPPATGGSATPAKQSLSFVPNRGQTDAQVRYYTRTPDFGAYFTRKGLTLDLHKGSRAAALELRFPGANRSATPEASVPTRGRVTYLVGGRRYADLPAFSEVRYRSLWPGIDLVFRGQDGALKYEFVVRPGADVSDIRLAYAGADSLALERGTLAVRTHAGTLRDAAPITRQGSRTVASRYALAGDSYGFVLGTYDRHRPLVIDPGLVWSTYLGGLDYDFPSGLGVDGSGAVYVTGETKSASFPTTPGAYDTSVSGVSDAFVTKFDANGGLVWSTYLGGAGSDSALDIAVDSSGHAYISGGTDSSDFPTTAGAYDTSPDPGSNAYITKLNASGTGLDYSTFFPAGARSLAVDEDGNAYVAGATFGSFPVDAGAPDTTAVAAEGFVAKLNAAGSALDYASYIGGRGNDWAYSITLDQDHNAYVFGETESIEEFPFTPGAYDTTNEVSSAGGNAFVAKINAAGTAFDYSTLFGTGYVTANEIAVDSSGNAYLAGNGAVPTTPGAFDTEATADGSFVAKLNAGGTALVYSTRLGGRVFCCPGPQSGTTAESLVVDATGRAYVAGSTGLRIPLTPGAVDTTVEGQSDAFLMKLNPTGSAIDYSSYFGGSGIDETRESSLRLVGPNSIVLGGFTNSTDFPTTPGAYDTSFNGGGGDLFVSRLQIFDRYPRPRGASPLRAALVPAYKQSSCSNSVATQHGAPLAYRSCPPALESAQLTTGTPDSNGLPVRMEAYMSFRVRPGNSATPADEADVQLALHVNQVLTKALTPYTGQIRARVLTRITDSDSAEAMSTTTDQIFGVTASCVPNSDPRLGSACDAATTMDALIPGAAREGSRAIWELNQVQVYDAGADGNVLTAADNTVFLRQGLFVP